MVAILSSTDKNANITVSGGGLVATDGGSAGTDHAGRGDTTTTIIGSSVSRYYEATATTIAGAAIGIGVANATNAFADGNYLGGQAHGLCWFSDGTVYNNGSQVATWAAYSQGDIVSIAVTGGGKTWGRVNGGNWNNDVIGNQNPATNTGGVSCPAGDLYPAYDLKGGSVWTFNFGATTFADTPPSGFAGFDVSGGPIEVVSGEAQVVGATLGVAGVPGLEIVVVPGVVEAVGATLVVTGTFEAIDVVAGIVEIVGAVILVNVAAAAIQVVPGEASIVGSTATLSNAIVVVSGEVTIEGATLTISAASIRVVPGEASISGSTLIVVGVSSSARGSVSASAGTTIAIGPVVILRTLRVLSEANALLDFEAIAEENWIEIGSLESIGEFGDQSTTVTHLGFGDTRTTKLKGPRDAITLGVVCARDPEDAGQSDMVAAEKTPANYRFRVIYNDEPTEDYLPSIDYFAGQVISHSVNIGDVNAITRCTFNVGVNTTIYSTAAAPTGS